MSRYMDLLESSFNAATVDQVMCRNLISVGWDGGIYDCDFNQMLDLPIVDSGGGKPCTSLRLRWIRLPSRRLSSAITATLALLVAVAVAAAR